MSRDTLRGLGVALLFVVLTVAMTWPQAANLSTEVYDSDDPLLSIWRVSWIAHILPKSPADLLNGNIFHPEKRTLAYSDSVLLEGIAGAPLIWSGVSRITTYNLLLLLSMALSGWAMWRYALYLTGHSAAAILAGITFAFVPFRFDHFHHLELQATIFLPLTLLYFERTIDRGSRRDAWLMAACYVAQVYSCIYYSVFLATALLPVAAARLWRLAPEQRRRVVRVVTPAAIVAAIVIAPYAYAYGLNRETLGERSDSDVRLYSATVSNYLATTDANVIHGDWSARFGQPERFLFPGVLAMMLAIIGALAIDQRRVSVLALGAIGFVISLGLNTPLYEPLRAILFPYRGLRAPARASILVFLAIAALGAYAWARLMRGRSKSTTAIATIVMAAALLVEFRTTLDRWLTLPEEPPQVYRWLALQPRSVVAEVPFARADSLHSIYDGLYMFNSTYHWQPIVNGYSGFFPKTFIELAEHTTSFPDDASIAYLKQRGVDFLVIHGGLMDRDAFGDMTAALLARPDMEPMAQFDERMGLDVVLRLRR
ncbi:MAG: hypothetical protein K2Y23_10760 [Cyanobacteria bacterium]|nr:hypothetical protein [Cyanobacteriota bacterium]